MGIVLFFSFIFDYFFGDLPNPYHPICLIGNLIYSLEVILRRILPKNKYAEFFGGVVLFIVVTFDSFAVPFFILLIMFKINPIFYWIFQVLLCSQAIAPKSLKLSVVKVYRSLLKNDMISAREHLSYIVGRDTQDLKEPEIIKAAIETTAENTSDGIVAPMFFILIGGAPLAYFYKAVNTLDSMVGYKNEENLYFGKFSARMDDIFNFMPSRLTAILMLLASFLLKLDYKNAFRVFIKSRNEHESPNAGQIESVAAGALQVQLGGDCYYFSKLHKKPVIGDNLRNINKQDIISAVRLMYTTAVLALILLLIFWAVLRFINA